MTKLGLEKIKKALEDAAAAVKKGGEKLVAAVDTSIHCKSEAQCYKGGNEWVGVTGAIVPYKCMLSTPITPLQFDWGVNWADDQWCKKAFPNQCNNGGCWMKTK